MVTPDYSKITHSFAGNTTGSCALCGRSLEHQLHRSTPGSDYLVEKEFASLQQKNEQLVAEIGRLKSDTRFKESDVQRLTTEIDAANKQLRACQKDVTTLHEINARQKQMIEQLEGKRGSTASVDTRYRYQIQYVARDDVSRLLAKDQEYGASWKRRGGVGAYMMMIRKIDRIMAIIPEPDGHRKHGFDVFAMLADESVGGSEQLLDTMRDLRGYLTLIEAEHRVRQEDLRSRPVTHAEITDREVEKTRVSQVATLAELGAHVFNTREIVAENRVTQKFITKCPTCRGTVRATDPVGPTWRLVTHEFECRVGAGECSVSGSVSISSGALPLDEHTDTTEPWPSDWDVRTLHGVQCDMLLGPCLCGEIHRRVTCTTCGNAEVFVDDAGHMALHFPKKWKGAASCARSGSHWREMGWHLQCDCGREQWPHQRTGACVEHERGEALSPGAIAAYDAAQGEMANTAVVQDSWLTTPEPSTWERPQSETATHGAEPDPDDDIPF